MRAACGTGDPRASAPGLLRRALAGLPQQARAGGRVALRAGAGYFAGQLARAARDEHIAFAIGARRIAPLWRLLDGVAEDDWREATGMDAAQVAVARLVTPSIAGTPHIRISGDGGRTYLARHARLLPADPPGQPGTRCFSADCGGGRNVGCMQAPYLAGGQVRGQAANRSLIRATSCGLRL